MKQFRLLVVIAIVGILQLNPASHAQFGDWPDVFDPFTLLTLNLQMDPADWNTIQNDTTLSVEVPAMFWADGEPPIQITVRRKSGDPLTATSTYTKVALKLDINDLVVGQSWHGLKKLSIENGDDQDVVSEGFAWWVERLASGTQGYGYDVGHAAWVRLFINGVDTGVYLNVEQVDKRYLENRGTYIEGETWLYKVSDVGSSHTLEVGGPQDSPTVDELCYIPFDKSGSCPQPDLATHTPQWVNMQGILTLMVCDSFQSNGDAMLTKGKNFFFADFLTGPLRRYFPWDRDSSLSRSPTYSIYTTGGPYATLLDVPEFRSQFNRIYNDLICGPWSEDSLIGFLDSIEPILTSALAADPNNRIGANVAGHFDSLRSWVTGRVAHVMTEIEGFQPCPSIQVNINEFMASNDGYLEDPDEPGEYPDWFELYNPTAATIDLGGVYLTDDPFNPLKYQVPTGVTIPAGGYLVFYADEDPEQGPLHTTFRLSAGGEGIYVYDTNGVTELDSIVFGAQPTNVAFGRYPDGDGSWGFMGIPTPGATNGPHNAPPVITGTARAPEAPFNTDSVLVTAVATDDSSVASVTLSYSAGSGWVDVVMNDNGASGDGGSGDGLYGGQIPAFPNGTVMMYYLTAIDDFGSLTTDPANINAYTYSYYVGYTAPALFINEFMADNDTVIEDPDQPGAYEDWLELYNAGPSAVDLGGMYLTDNLSNPVKFQIPSGVSIPSGGYLIFWADDDPNEGPTHANFRLALEGEVIGLLDTDAFGNMPIDIKAFGAQTSDTSQARCPDGSETWEYFDVSTPGAPNGPCGSGGPVPTLTPTNTPGGPTPTPTHTPGGPTATPTPTSTPTIPFSSVNDWTLYR